MTFGKRQLRTKGNNNQNKPKQEEERKTNTKRLKPVTPQRETAMAVLER